MMQPLTYRLRAFWRDESAVVALETVVMTPLLIWAYLMSFVFFDAYRVYNTSVKTTYMMADWISRQTNPVFEHDIEGMARINDSIVRGVGQSQMRVSQIANISGTLDVEWTHPINGMADLFDSDLPGLAGQLPNLPNGERIVLVETRITYEAPFGEGLTITRFDNMAVIRPRYAGQVTCCATGLPPAPST